MDTNKAKELFLAKMRQFPADRWKQSDDVVRFLRERAQRKGLGGGASPSDYAAPEQAEQNPQKRA